MAVYNTGSDAANTAVRAFLTKIGEHYLGRTFNTGSGSGKAHWLKIKEKTFLGGCCYCGEKADKLQIEHLLMFNRKQYGLHHPGNTAPCCAPCNKRSRDADNEYADWETHLRKVCDARQERGQFRDRHQRIADHMSAEGYPVLTDEERHAIRVIANTLYENTKQELERSATLYQKLDEAFISPN